MIKEYSKLPKVSAAHISKEYSILTLEPAAPMIKEYSKLPKVSAAHILKEYSIPT
jgi:hypothetical protein